MKIVLRDDVENLGRKGDVVDVADGYARNYLVPRGLAMKATKGVVAQAESMRRNRSARDARERDDRGPREEREPRTENTQELGAEAELEAGEGIEGVTIDAVTSAEAVVETAGEEL